MKALLEAFYAAWLNKRFPNKTHRKLWLSSFFATLWSLWMHRNEIIFKQHVLDMQTLAIWSNGEWQLSPKLGTRRYHTRLKWWHKIFKPYRCCLLECEVASQCSVVVVECCGLVWFSWCCISVTLSLFGPIIIKKKRTTELKQKTKNTWATNPTPTNYEENWYLLIKLQSFSILSVCSFKYLANSVQLLLTIFNYFQLLNVKCNDFQLITTAPKCLLSVLTVLKLPLNCSQPLPITPHNFLQLLTVNHNRSQLLSITFNC